MDPTLERSEKLKMEFESRKKKIPGYVEGVNKKYHCYVKVKKLNSTEINGQIRKYARM